MRNQSYAAGTESNLFLLLVIEKQDRIAFSPALGLTKLSQVLHQQINPEHGKHH
jgi:hypothetical protein